VVWLGLVLWYLMPLSTIFQLFRGGQFYEWSITTVVLYINIPLAIIDDNVCQFEVIFIYSIQE
jgi:hypothetical protein